ncbi:BREX-1 system phosphatase PglZ type A [Priestia aryabhattai]|uniref:BREX-1 system phosphatase PglZ type A n=1 Tax=Priestia aryabhattai TaxID=412384 RepID=UPI002E21FDDD|nr:BREX-1 system phosphatase PglZ type A [Priestia aryabhattai]MED3919512.1 BREX-1 system phosphatase PglZ type A [Priestia aryabhattai]
MNIIEELLRLFQEQLVENKASSRAIVFWYDTQSNERDLEAIKQALHNEGIRFWELNKSNVFRTKVLLELEDTENSYLVYAPFTKPKDEDNFLIDVLLYGGKFGEFQADEVAIKMKELRLDHLSVRPLIEKHWAFFKSQKRIAKFKKLLPNTPNPDHIEQTMLAVLVNAKSIHPQDLLKSVILLGGTKQSNEAFVQIEKYMDSELFFDLVEDYFGIRPSEDNRLFSIMEHIVFQHYAFHVDEKILPGAYPSKVPNICKVFIDDWLKSDERSFLENVLDELERHWGVSYSVDQYTYQAFIRCDTFSVIERKILDALYDLFISETVLPAEWKGILAERSKSYWYKTRFYEEYELVEKVLEFYEQKALFEKNSPLSNSQQWYEAYTNQYYVIDQLYRQIYVVFVKGKNLDRYQELMQRVTFWYEAKYLPVMGKYTDDVLDTELVTKWKVPGVVGQRHFYSTYIRPIMEGTRERVFVIISDALRYEAGKELADKFGQRLNAEVQISSMQATIPTYTQLGMAALLPGKITDISSDGQVFVDGVSTKGIQNRNKILQMHEPDSIALNMEQFISLNKESGQEYIRGKRVVYLYHDNIDAVGDSSKTERYTFEAVESTIERIQATVRKLTGTYEAARIFMTTDHGFLYQASEVEKYQKTEGIKGTVFDSNRRFAVGNGLNVPQGSVKVSLDYLGLTGVEAVIAKGLNRFTTGGGQRFVHGGAMPQESIVPVIEYRQVKGKARKSEQARVNVRVSSIQKVITSYQFIVPFFQEEKVSNELRERTLRAAFYRSGERISNELTITFDAMGDVSTRQTEAVFHLLEDRYKTGDICLLRLEDVSGRTTELYSEEEFELKLYSV